MLRERKRKKTARRENKKKKNNNVTSVKKEKERRKKEERKKKEKERKRKRREERKKEEKRRKKEKKERKKERKKKKKKKKKRKKDKCNSSTVCFLCHECCSYESFQYVFCLLIQMSLLFTLTIWTLCSVSLTSICTPAVFVSSYRTTWSRRALWVCVEQPDKGLTEVWFYIIIWHVLSEASFFSYNNEILPPFFLFFCHYSLLRQDKKNVVYWKPVFIKWTTDTVPLYHKWLNM